MFEHAALTKDPIDRVAPRPSSIREACRLGAGCWAITRAEREIEVGNGVNGVVGHGVRLTGLMRGYWWIVPRRRRVHGGGAAGGPARSATPRRRCAAPAAAALRCTANRRLAQQALGRRTGDTTATSFRRRPCSRSRPAAPGRRPIRARHAARLIKAHPCHRGAAGMKPANQASTALWWCPSAIDITATQFGWPARRAHALTSPSRLV